MSFGFLATPPPPPFPAGATPTHGEQIVQLASGSCLVHLQKPLQQLALSSPSPVPVNSLGTENQHTLKHHTSHQSKSPATGASPCKCDYPKEQELPTQQGTSPHASCPARIMPVTASCLAPLQERSYSHHQFAAAHEEGAFVLQPRSLKAAVENHQCPTVRKHNGIFRLM